MNSEFFKSMESLQLSKYDFAYLYSDFRKLYDPSKNSKIHFLEKVVNILSNRIENLIIPTFTYTREGYFRPESTITKLGGLNTFIHKMPDSYTSDHPMFSYTGIGSKSINILKDVGLSAFGDDSLLERLFNNNCVFIHLGRPPALGNTLVHRVEQVSKVRYREEIQFKTKVIRGREIKTGPYSAFLRNMHDVKNSKNSTDFRAAAQFMIESGVYKPHFYKSEYDCIWVAEYDRVNLELHEILSREPKSFL